MTSTGASPPRSIAAALRPGSSRSTGWRPPSTIVPGSRSWPRQTHRARSMRTATRATRCGRRSGSGGQSDDETRLDLTERLARCAERSGELREAVRLWESIARETGSSDPLRAARAKRELGVAYRLLGRRDRAAAVRADAADAFAAAGELGEAAEVRLRMAWDHEAESSDVALELLETAEREALQAGRVDLVAQARGSRGQLLARRGRVRRRRGDRRRGARVRALERARERDLRRVLVRRGDRDDARRLSRRDRRARGGGRALPGDGPARRRGGLHRVPREDALEAG